MIDPRKLGAEIRAYQKFVRSMDTFLDNNLSRSDMFQLNSVFRIYFRLKKELARADEI